MTRNSIHIQIDNNPPEETEMLAESPEMLKGKHDLLLSSHQNSTEIGPKNAVAFGEHTVNDYSRKRSDPLDTEQERSSVCLLESQRNNNNDD